MQHNLKRYREIGNRVAIYRKLRNYTQEELASRAGTTRNYISKIEAPSAQKPFSLDILFSIADALDVDVAAFFHPVDESKYTIKKRN